MSKPEQLTVTETGVVRQRGRKLERFSAICLPSAIDPLAMPHAENQNHQAVIFDFADQSVIAHAVFPELPQPRAVQRLSNAARIVEFRHSSMQELQDSLSVLRVELAEFAVGGLRQFNAPGHDVSERL